MKQKVLSLLLTAACCLSLTAPVLATDWKEGLPEDLANLIGEITQGEDGWSISINPGVPYIPNSSWHAPEEPSTAPTEPVKTDTKLSNFKKVNTYRTGMFSDVSEQDWFAKNVKAVYEYGLMNGNGDKFNPRNNITLAQALAIACRLHSIAQTGEASFKQGSPWYQVYLDYARENGISGVENVQDYNVPATRRDVAKLLAGAMPDALTPKNNIGSKAIPDVPEGADGYAEIQLLYQSGVAGGDSTNHAYQPDEAISRAEVAAMTARMVDPSLRLELSIPDPGSSGKPSGSSATANQTADPLFKGKTTGGTLPAFDDKATQEKALALLDRYDPDGAFILRKAGGNFMRWFSLGGRTLLKGIGTAVHEEYHSMAFYTSTSMLGMGQRGDVYYAGNGVLLPVTQTKVYSTKEMIPYIPADLQDTSRFDTYVNTEESNMSSVVEGIYGLMNEFTAYGCGLNNAVALYDFYKANAKSVDDWFQYINDGANDRLAYAEFRYYILTYMLYAKDKHPDVYQGIMNNQEFKDAFNRVESWFAGNIQRYENTLSEIKQMFENTGHRVQIAGGWFQVDGRGTSIFDGDYQKLMKAMSAEKYQTELAALKG